MKGWSQRVIHTVASTFAPWKDPYRFRLLYRGLLIALIGAILVSVCGLTVIQPSAPLSFWEAVFTIVVIDFCFCCALGLVFYAVSAMLYASGDHESASRAGEWGTACIWWWLIPLVVAYAASSCLSA